MVYEINRRERSIYQCELCLFGYEDLETAERCEQYCATHESCSPPIMRKAVFKPEPKVMSYPLDLCVEFILESVSLILGK